MEHSENKISELADLVLSNKDDKEIWKLIEKINALGGGGRYALRQALYEKRPNNYKDLLSKFKIL